MPPTPRQIKRWLADGRKIRDWIDNVAPRMISELCQEQSLRGLARKLSFSPTYLSQVRHSNVRLSVAGFLQLSDLYEREHGGGGGLDTREQQSVESTVTDNQPHRR